MTAAFDTILVCTACLWRAAHAPDCPHRDEPWPTIPVEPEPPRKKTSYVGAPAVFALEMACQDINSAFDGYGCYLVGSALERADWRDVDVRFVMSDEAFTAEFPHAGPVSHVRWEFDTKWLLLTIAISERLTRLTGLPVDFQFQPQSHANARHKGPRSALGMRLTKTPED